VYQRAPEAIHRSISDRLSAVTLPLDAVFSPSRCRTLAGLKTLIIIAAYAPRMGHHEGKARNVKRFYTNLAKFKAELLQDDPKAVIIMGGDFNARVKQDAPHPRHAAVGPYSLVLSCFFRVHPLGGLFLAHAEAGLHCTMQSITPPWAGCSGLMHLISGHCAALTHVLPVLDHKIVEITIRSDLSISPISLEIAQIPIILLLIILLNSPFE